MSVLKKDDAIQTIQSYLAPWFPDGDVSISSDFDTGNTKFRILIGKQIRLMEVTAEFLEDLEDPAASFSERFETNQIAQKLTSEYGRVVFYTNRVEGVDPIKRRSLKAFGVDGFKSYEQAEIRLEPLTVLIGANASGKSNLLEGFRLFSWLAKGRRLDELFYAVKQNELSLRGAIGQFFRKGSRFKLSCRIDEIETYDTLETTISGEGGTFVVSDERITSKRNPNAMPLIEVAGGKPEFSHEIPVQYNNFSRGGHKPRVNCSDAQVVFTQLQSSARFENTKAQRIIPAVTRSFVDCLSRIIFLDPVPSRMRGPAFIADKRLHDDGGNISAVLYDLCVTESKKEELLAFIRLIPEQEILDMNFEVGARNDVFVKLNENFVGMGFTPDAGVLSDGTLRVLAIAAALLSAPEQSLVVIEEIDNGVHPSRARMLLDNMLKTAKARGLSVLVTTHNPALLDNLPKEALPAVTCCFRDPMTGSSNLVRLDEIKRYPELILQGTLGSLMTNGILDSYLKPTFSDTELKRRYNSWLDGLTASEPEQ